MSGDHAKCPFGKLATSFHSSGQFAGFILSWCVRNPSVKPR